MRDCFLEIEEFRSGVSDKWTSICTFDIGFRAKRPEMSDFTFVCVWKGCKLIELSKGH